MIILPEWAQWLIAVGSIAGALTAIFFGARKGWRALSVIVKVGDALPALIQLPAFIERTDATLAQQNQQIEEIHHEVKYNNGSSVKDAIGRVEKVQTTNSKKIGTIQRANTRIEKGVKGLYDRVDANEQAATVDRANIAATQKELEDTRPAPRRRATKPKEQS
ncbi:MAG TPA: hypothetical protein VGI56_13920 [Galbitalea sp.]|jgi:hypothetical protein